MKKILLILCVIFASQLFADFSKKATVIPKLVQDGVEKNWSPMTGLKISDFYKTSYISKLKSNGRYRQYASFSGLVLDSVENGIDMNYIKALDAKKQIYIDAKKAYFLIGSSITPTFGDIAILAFKNKKDALDYSQKYGGKITNFDITFKTIKKNLNSSMAYMQNIYKKKQYPMGERVYKKKCKKIDLSDFIEINELKAQISNGNICGSLSEKHLQALVLYLWDVKREGGTSNKAQKVKVNEDEKCPVCGMFVYKYPRWASQIFYKHANHKHHLSFDGVKDMMKFYFNNKKWGKYDFAKKKNITKILVTDYYSQKAIDARSAYFVLGGNIYGPMGNELIPFKNEQDAQNFKLDHKGKRILKFSEITEDIPYSLDTK